MLPSFANFESQTRLNRGMLRLFSGVVNEIATRRKSHFIFPATALYFLMFYICSQL
jgi:hypothetical protein